MDDIEMLLPGLKVSSSLVRQRPLSPNGDDAEQEHGQDTLHVGSKRRHWGDAEGHPAAALDAKRHVSAAKRLTRCLRLPTSSATSDPSDAALHCLQAGITSNMLDELTESPRLNPACLSPASLAASAEAELAVKCPDPISTKLKLSMTEPELCSSPSHSAPASCVDATSRPGVSAKGVVGESRHLSTTGEPEEWGTDSAVTPEMFQKMKSAPPRLELSLQTLSRTADAQPVTPGFEQSSQRPGTLSLSREHTPPPTVGAGSAQGTPPGAAKCSLSRAEKWHERINMATLRLRARSLPLTPPRGRATPSLAAAK